MHQFNTPTDDDSNVLSLIFDKSNLTYIERVIHKNRRGDVIKSFEPKVGVCYESVKKT